MRCTRMRSLGWKPALTIRDGILTTLRFLQDNTWLAVAADRAILFETPLEQRWSNAARLMGVDLTLLTDYAGHA